MSTCLWRRTKR